MDIAVRPLAEFDINQVREIEREAFSSTWPTTSFKRELQNRNSAYLVACQPQEVDARPAEGPLAEDSRQYAPLVGRVVVGWDRRAQRKDRAVRRLNRAGSR